MFLLFWIRWDDPLYLGYDLPDFFLLPLVNKAVPV
jgi:hypothetical protein